MPTPCPAGKHDWRLVTVEATADRFATFTHYDIFWYCTKCRIEQDYVKPERQPYS